MVIGDNWPNQINSTRNFKNKLNVSSSNSKLNRTKSADEINKKQILQLVEDQPVEIYCEVIGSRPAPLFSWYLGDQKLPSNHFTQWPPSNSRAPSTNSLTSLPRSSSISLFNNNFYSAQSISINNNKTNSVNNLNNIASTALTVSNHIAISTLHFKPTVEADGKQLTCRAENTLLSDHRFSFVEHHVQLDVQCKFKNFIFFTN